MTKAYIVYQQYYEEVFVYGVFLSERRLEDALTLLAEHHLQDAKKRKQYQQEQYEKYHKPWAKHRGVEPTEPYCMTVDLHEYSKSLFDVHEIEVDKVIFDPSIIWFDSDD